MIIQRIATLELAGLEPYRTLRRPVEHHRQGVFVAEGEKVVRRLLESTLEVSSLLMTPEWFESLRPVLESRSVEVFVAPKAEVETIVGFPLHQGIMALGKVPAERSLTETLAGVPHPLLLVAMDGLTNSENIGILVRNSVAFGVHAIIVGETSSSPYLRRAVRNSMGAVFQIPVIHSHHLGDTLTVLRSKFGTRVLAAHPAGGQDLTSADFRGHCCLVLGSEGEGISNSVLQSCDAAISLRMENGVDSLNVGSASAVFLYEAVRQREGKDPKAGIGE
ncbi:MAG: RNA methyltransferase [Bacteroidota bacterium]